MIRGCTACSPTTPSKDSFVGELDIWPNTTINWWQKHRADAFLDFLGQDLLQRGLPDAEWVLAFRQKEKEEKERELERDEKGNHQENRR